ncbi:hypothetical protein KP509_22G017200 [Ceratopteris richardii]|uniref:Uncharacterized protein n=1 Tax=Ceratopteris richardii TaxID=49495 RepID=A0A8T2S5M9_CERRI|nr:hypothetical protein KP509_22G017200 [Ceratopteris richardii]
MILIMMDIEAIASHSFPESAKVLATSGLSILKKAAKKIGSISNHYRQEKVSIVDIIGILA